ncbi:MAG: response regulator [Nitrospirae bacterium]|nr:MAG: response regulator [Nitrospirota bacterium]
MKKILVIDDDPDVAEVLGFYLRSFGYECEIVQSGADGLKRIDSDGYHAVITDFMMPDIKGDRLIEDVSRRFPHLKGRLFLITGATVEKDTENLITSLGGRVIRKPFTRQTLEEALEGV